MLEEIPSMDGVRKCIVDENVIVNRTRPLLMSERKQELPYAERA
jgi:hypothetical protein